MSRCMCGDCVCVCGGGVCVCVGGSVCVCMCAEGKVYVCVCVWGGGEVGREICTRYDMVVTFQGHCHLPNKAQ